MFLFDRAGGPQELLDGRVAIAARDAQGRSPFFCAALGAALPRPHARVHVGAARDEQLHGLEIAAAAGSDQRVLVAGDDQIDAGTAVEQQRDDRDMSFTPRP